MIKKIATLLLLSFCFYIPSANAQYDQQDCYIALIDVANYSRPVRNCTLNDIVLAASFVDQEVMLTMMELYNEAEEIYQDIEGWLDVLKIEWTNVNGANPHPQSQYYLKRQLIVDNLETLMDKYRLIYMMNNNVFNNWWLTRHETPWTPVALMVPFTLYDAKQHADWCDLARTMLESDPVLWPGGN